MTIHWFGCYLQKESVKVGLNGQPFPPDMEITQDAPEIIAGRISAGEKLKPGTNRVRIEALDIKGVKCVRELVLHYYPDNRIPLGDEFSLNLGLEEPKTAPSTTRSSRAGPSRKCAGPGSGRHPSAWAAG